MIHHPRACSPGSTRSWNEGAFPLLPRIRRLQPCQHPREPRRGHPRGALRPPQSDQAPQHRNTRHLRRPALHQPRPRTLPRQPTRRLPSRPTALRLNRQVAQHRIRFRPPQAALYRPQPFLLQLPLQPRQSRRPRPPYQRLRLLRHSRPQGHRPLRLPSLRLRRQFVRRHRQVVKGQTCIT